MLSDAANAQIAPAAAAPQGPGRLALVCTPRTGNNWLRHTLGNLYDLPTCSVHTPDEVDWDNLPEHWLFAIHWRPTAAFRERLTRHGFRVVALTRHPLDVLISVLQFCWRSDSTEHWLQGDGGDERPLWGAMPRSAALRAYAAGPRAAALLSVSREWWAVPGTVRVRYEDLIADGPGTVEGLARTLGGRPRKTPAEALGATTLPALRALSGRRHHFWQGRPGLWKELLPAAEAAALAAAVGPALAEFGYVCDPDPALTPEQADANWVRLVGEDLVKDLRRLESLKGELTEAHARLAQADESVRQVIAEAAWRRSVQEQQAETIRQLTAEQDWRRQNQERQAEEVRKLTAELAWRHSVQEQQAEQVRKLTAERDWRRENQEQQAEQTRKLTAELAWVRQNQEQQAETIRQLTAEATWRREVQEQQAEEVRKLTAEAAWRRELQEQQAETVRQLTAEVAWRREAQEQQAEEVRRLTTELTSGRSVQEQQTADLEARRTAQARLEIEVATMQQTVAVLNGDVVRLRERLAPLEGVTPFALGLARGLQRLSRAPLRAARPVRGLLRLVTRRPGAPGRAPRAQTPEDIPK